VKGTVNRDHVCEVMFAGSDRGPPRIAGPWADAPAVSGDFVSRAVSSPAVTHGLLGEPVHVRLAGESHEGRPVPLVQIARVTVPIVARPMRKLRRQAHGQSSSLQSTPLLLQHAPTMCRSVAQSGLPANRGHIGRARQAPVRLIRANAGGQRHVCPPCAGELTVLCASQ
jgi:hypothetical protein